MKKTILMLLMTLIVVNIAHAALELNPVREEYSPGETVYLGGIFTTASEGIFTIEQTLTKGSVTIASHQKSVRGKAFPIQIPQLIKPEDTGTYRYSVKVTDTSGSVVEEKSVEFKVEIPSGVFGEPEGDIFGDDTILDQIAEFSLCGDEEILTATGAVVLDIKKLSPITGHSTIEVPGCVDGRFDPSYAINIGRILSGLKRKNGALESQGKNKIKLTIEIFGTVADKIIQKDESQTFVKDKLIEGHNYLRQSIIWAVENCPDCDTAGIRLKAVEYVNTNNQPQGYTKEEFIGDGNLIDKYLALGTGGIGDIILYARAKGFIMTAMESCGGCTENQIKINAKLLLDGVPVSEMSEAEYNEIAELIDEFDLSQIDIKQPPKVLNIPSSFNEPPEAYIVSTRCEAYVYERNDDDVNKIGSESKVELSGNSGRLQQTPAVSCRKTKCEELVRNVFKARTTEVSDYEYLIGEADFEKEKCLICSADIPEVSEDCFDISCKFTISDGENEVIAEKSVPEYHRPRCEKIAGSGSSDNINILIAPHISGYKHDETRYIRSCGNYEYLKREGDFKNIVEDFAETFEKSYEDLHKKLPEYKNRINVYALFDLIGDLSYKPIDKLPESINLCGDHDKWQIAYITGDPKTFEWDASLKGRCWRGNADKRNGIKTIYKNSGSVNTLPAEGYVAVTISAVSSDMGILAHEFGHCIFDLDDEYSSLEAGLPTIVHASVLPFNNMWKTKEGCEAEMQRVNAAAVQDNSIFKFTKDECTEISDQAYTYWHIKDDDIMEKKWGKFKGNELNQIRWIFDNVYGGKTSGATIDASQAMQIAVLSISQNPGTANPPVPTTNVIAETRMQIITGHSTADSAYLAPTDENYAKVVQNIKLLMKNPPGQKEPIPETEANFQEIVNAINKNARETGMPEWDSARIMSMLLDHGKVDTKLVTTQPSKKPKSSFPLFIILAPLALLFMIFFIYFEIYNHHLGQTQEQKNKEIQIKTFVRNAKSKGYSEESIRNHLIKYNVPVKLIDESFKK